SPGSPWSMTAQPPTDRFGLATSTANGKVYAIGGMSASGLLRTVEVYDPSSNSWSTAAPMPTGRFYLATAALNGRIYAIGGGNRFEIPLNTVEVYDPSS